MSVQCLTHVYNYIIIYLILYYIIKFSPVHLPLKWPNIEREGLQLSIANTIWHKQSPWYQVNYQTVMAENSHWLVWISEITILTSHRLLLPFYRDCKTVNNHLNQCYHLSQEYLFTTRCSCMSDNRPQYSSEQFAEFASKYGFSHITSSPKYP